MSFGGHVGLRVAEGIGNAVRAHRAQQAEEARQAALDRLNALRLQEAEFDLQSKMDRRHMEEVAQLELARQRRAQQPLLDAHRSVYKSQFEGDPEFHAAMADYDAERAGLDVPKALGAGRSQEEARIRLDRLRGTVEDEGVERDRAQAVRELLADPQAQALMAEAAASGNPRAKAQAMQALGAPPEVFNAAFEEMRRGTRFDQRAPLRTGAEPRDPQELRLERARVAQLAAETEDRVTSSITAALEAELAQERERAGSEGRDEPVALDPRQEAAVALETLQEQEVAADRGLMLIETYRTTGQPQLLMNGLGMDPSEDPEQFVMDIEEMLLAHKASILRLRREFMSRSLRNIGTPPRAEAQARGDAFLQQQRDLRER